MDTQLKASVQDIIGPILSREVSNYDERHTRGIADRLLTDPEILMGLAKMQVPIESLIRAIHMLATVGGLNQEGKELKSGVYRREDVGFGEYIAPRPSHLQEAMTVFTQKLDELLAQRLDSEDDMNLLAVWAYVHLIAIHPFEDGNGRCSRGVLSFIRARGCNQLGIPYEPLLLPDGSHMNDTDEEAIQAFLSTIEPNLINWQQPEGPARLFSLQNKFGVLVSKGLLDQHSAQLCEALKRSVNQVKSIADIRENPIINALAKNIRNSGSWLTGRETKVLLADEAAQQAKRVLSEPSQ